MTCGRRVVRGLIIFVWYGLGLKEINWCLFVLVTGVERSGNLAFLRVSHGIAVRVNCDTALIISLRARNGAGREINVLIGCRADSFRRFLHRNDEAKGRRWRRRNRRPSMVVRFSREFCSLGVVLY